MILINILFQTYVAGDSQNGLTCGFCDRYPADGLGSLIGVAVVIGIGAIIVSALRSPGCGPQGFALVVGAIILVLLVMAAPTENVPPGDNVFRSIKEASGMPTSVPVQQMQPIPAPQVQQVLQVQDIGGGRFRYWMDGREYCAPGSVVNGQVQIVVGNGGHTPC